MMNAKKNSLDAKIIMTAMRSALQKLHPAVQIKSPVMFIVYVGAIFTTYVALRDALSRDVSVFLVSQISLWLWFTVLFANFAEAIAEGRGKAQAQSLRSTRSNVQAKKMQGDTWQLVNADTLRKGDVLLVEAGNLIPSDGEIIEGMATVDESAVTGESAPVIR